ncbi:stage V sporulation protein B [Oikeobacillus pervagus]|uniref:Stage V sporulation protein B n=1 Tax=Oikeobacillus pervagus TaxID=1325931 RepID=A0AAJ1SZN4_9BACI|nr:stage V sporulation protein B [Oikeobacillus pervagus]MDQ0214587.1 stage V sporulation protein B [Oikeobacillus pervagus]
MSKFLKGTMILMVATFITKILGFVNRIVIARFIGEEGVGLYMMAFPTFILVLTMTQLGLPVAISKNVAEAEARGDTKKIKKILAVSLTTTLSLSVILTPTLFILAPYLAKTLFTDPRTYYPLVAITPVIPIIAISSVIRGYFQGKQNMKPAAISQILEQVVRITFIAVLTKTFLPYGVEYAAAAAMVATIIGEVIALIYLFTMFKIKKKFRVRRNFFKAIHSGKETLNDLMRIALPTTGSRMIGSLSWFFEPIVVAHSLAIAGVAATMATKQYGMLTGYALPVLFLPSFITISLSTSLVPAISEANSSKNFRLVEHRVQEALRFCLVSGGLAVIVLYLYAEPLMQVMYGSTKGAPFIQLMAPFFLFYYYQGPLQAVLQALDLANAALINSLIGAIVKIVLIFFLASLPTFGIYGAALGIVAGILLVTLLHLATVMKKIAITIYIRDYLKFLLIVVITMFISHYGIHHFLKDQMIIVQLLIGIFITSFLYLAGSFLFGLLTKKDLAKIPFIKKFF